MSLANEYKRQFRWRNWRAVLDMLPPLKGMTILDLGCSVGDQAAELVARGARVFGYDMDKELIRIAQARGLSMTEFQVRDLREGLDLDVCVDGIWCSFTAAFFPNLPEVLCRWAKNLKPDGWLVVTEIDDLFGHEPLAAETKTLLNAYVDEAFSAGRYDFRMGRKLERHVLQAGFRVSKVFTLADQELSFNGRAQSEVLEAWRNRFARMELLRRFCGEKARSMEDDFIMCLGRDDHSSLAKVYCCIANKPSLI